MSETKRKYDSTIARMAGNIIGHLVTVDTPPEHDERMVKLSVVLARAIVAEIERTDQELAARAARGEAP